MWCWRAVLALLACALPARAVVVQAGSDVPAHVVTTLNHEAASVQAALEALTGQPAPVGIAFDVRITRDLHSNEALTSTPGTVWVRPQAQPSRASLRHELVHQLLFRVCPQATRDALFHEAVATRLSGELATWPSEPHLSLPEASRIVEQQPLASTRARHALARLLKEQDDLPAPLLRALHRCGDGAAWMPLSVRDLVTQPGGQADAVVVLHMTTGEVLAARFADEPVPLGSVLKPFVLAGAAQDITTLAPERVGNSPAWKCGDVRGAMTATQALAHSCNGYFLQAFVNNTAPFGTLLPLLLDAGLSRAPTDVAEAIGLRAAITMTPKAVAQAYRVLLLSRPDIRAALLEHGTLRDDRGVDLLSGVMAKTGSVRDEASNAHMGMLVAAHGDVLVVRVKSGVAGRALASDVRTLLARHTARRHHSVQVQLFALVPVHNVQLRCSEGPMYTLTPVPQRLPDDVIAAQLASFLAPVTCMHGELVASFDEHVGSATAARSRRYPGTVRWDCPPGRANASGATLKQQRARSGSCVVLSTSLSTYASGVLAAEAASLRGAARTALVRAIVHNVTHGETRHGGRPLCDTTHCQVFLGAVKAAPLNDDDIAPIRGTRTWLPFAAGGDAPWQATRPRTAVTQALGALDGLRVQGQQVAILRASHSAGDDGVDVIGCEVLRSALALPSCPTRITEDGDSLGFFGEGAGHGLGLDVADAQKRGDAGESSDAILKRALQRTR